MRFQIWLSTLLLCWGEPAFAQFGGYHFNNYGQLVDARGLPANPHQQIHDMLNPDLWTTGAVAVSNTVDPGYQQADLATIEGAMTPIPEPGGQAMSRLYLTPGNPYTPHTGVIGGSPVGYNYDHYQKILLDAAGGGYQATGSGAYIAKTHPDSSGPLYDWGFHTYENEPDFQAARAAAGGSGGGIVVMANQSAEAYSHLKAISGSNEYMTAYVRPSTGGAIALGGQVVLNPEHNTTPALDTSPYGPAFVAGVSQYQGQTLATGNETGFWVTGTGGNTQISGWGDGSANSIEAAYNPDAQFHVHTHSENTGPSYADFLASALLGGMPGMVISGNSNYAYGFQVVGGALPTTNGGVVVFGDTGWASRNNAGAANNSGLWGRAPTGSSGFNASPAQGPTSGVLGIGVNAEGTFGSGGAAAGGVVLGFDSRGNLNIGVNGGLQATAGLNAGIGAVTTYNPSGTLNAGFSGNPVGVVNVAGVAIAGSASVDLSDPNSVTYGGQAGLRVGISVAVGTEGSWATTVVSSENINSLATTIRGVLGLNFDSSTDAREGDLSRVSSFYGGTYGGPNTASSYHDNGANYGGRDGNTSPDGSAINGHV